MLSGPVATWWAVFLCRRRTSQEPGLEGAEALGARWLALAQTLASHAAGIVKTCESLPGTLHRLMVAMVLDGDARASMLGDETVNNSIAQRGTEWEYL